MYLADNFASKIIKNGQVLAERHEVMIITLPTIIASPLLRAGCPDTAKKVRTTKSVKTNGRFLNLKCHLPKGARVLNHHNQRGQ
jgi:hypothetical protein